eukprot:g2683.t1
MEQLVNGLTPDEKKILKKAFDKIDMDKNGQIDPKELRVFLSLKWKQILPSKTIESVVRLADVDSDGMISFKEFARFQVKYMPLCRGYCADCKKVILGIDGWQCTKCSSSTEKGPQSFFALCLRCYSKPQSTRIPHQHPISDMKRFSISGIGDGKVEELNATTEVYDRNVLKPLLRRHLKKVEQGNDDEDYWTNALNCIMQ